ncbi:DUF551 domain-containing protein [Burkholderia multivorans]|uniref:DUF551 domain-containing protein n=1 Tax=Burkholderia multivorans TaxID=87883 RepID=UPI000CFF3A80|nr:DUF551 domain-containing protein [Burkholderia multivorans]MBR8241078.1 DUF551 domain-containing protein [Burkholderia multivorans]PRG35659.1 DUF551 domain-containing protein [Burkholderia multivorans]
MDEREILRIAAHHDIDEYLTEALTLEFVRDVLKAARRTTPDREAWISVEDRLPEEGQAVAFVVHWPGDEFLHGRVLGGTFHSYGGKMPTFSVPGTGFEATHWMPLPTAPADASRAQGGEKS